MNSFILEIIIKQEHSDSVNRELLNSILSCKDRSSKIHAPPILAYR